MTPGRQILEVAFRQSGARHHQDPRFVKFLETEGLQLHDSDEDLPLFTIYEDITTKGRLLTRCECVIPGRNTVRAFPSVAQFGIHVRKTYEPDAPPLRRGETPQVEFERTMKARRRMQPRQASCVLPLAFEPLLFRSRLIPGATFAALSPFKEVKETDSACVKMTSDAAVMLHAQLEDLHCCAERLHDAGLVHGDLHLENVLWTGGEGGHSVPIDFAACVFREEVSPSEWQEAVFEDKREILREAAFLQLSMKVALKSPVFAEARKMAKSILIPSLAEQVAGLRIIDPTPSVSRSPGRQHSPSREI